MNFNKKMCAILFVLCIGLVLAGCSGLFLEKYALIAEILEGEGLIIVSPSLKEYKEGTKVTVTAVGKDGWEFYEWSGGLNGNKNPQEFTINSDKNIGAKFNRAPVLNYTGNLVKQEGEKVVIFVMGTDDDGDTLTYSASSPTAGLADYFSPDTQLFSWVTGPGDAGTYTITFSVSDGKRTTTETLTITIETSNHAPVLSPIGDKVVTEGQKVSFGVTATDADGDTLTYSASSPTAGLTAYFNPDTRFFSWKTGLTDAGVYTITFSVSDGKVTIEETITITVEDNNQPPVLSPIGDKVVTEGQKVYFGVTATDADGDTLTYSASSPTPGLTAYFNPDTRFFSWKTGLTDAGVYTITFSVSDGKVTVEETITITVQNVDQAPVLDPIGNKVVAENTELYFVVSGSDPDGDVITLSVINLPQGASFDSVTGVFSWTPTYNDAGTYEVTFVATANGKNTSEMISITVNDKIKPMSVEIDQTYINTSNMAAMSFTFSEAEIARTYTYSIDDTDGGTLPVSGTGQTTASNQQISGINVSSLKDGILTLTVYLTDGAGNQGSAVTDTVPKDTVAPAAPTVSGIATGTYNTNQSFSVTGEAGATLEYSLDNGATWNVYLAQVTLSVEGTYSVLARQTDLAGNQSVNSGLITVVIDKTAPAAPTVVGIVTGIYNTNQSFTVTGEAGAILEYSLNNGTSWNVYTTQVTLSVEGTYEVIARQTDVTGNQSASSSVITVTIDKTAPAAPTVAGIATGTYNTNQSFSVTGEAGATLEYSLDNGATWSVYSAQVTLSAEGTYSVLARQTDLAGNQSVNSGLITVVIDKTAPAAPTVVGIVTGIYKTNQSFTVTGEAGAILEYSLNNGTSWSVYTTQVTLSVEGTYEVIARQTDVTGNQSASSSVITVTIDKTAPAAPTVAGIATGTYNTNQSFSVTGEAGATLEYSLDNGATWSVYLTQVTLSVEGTYSVLARQTDLAGNQSVNSGLITVVIDKTAPAAPTVVGIVTGIYKTNQSFTVTGEAGAILEYSLNNGTSWSVYTTQVTLSIEGTYEVIARQTDVTGNRSASSSVITVTLDKTAPAAPAVSGIATGTYNTNQSFSVTGEAGATLEYSLDNGTTWNVYLTQVTLSVEGTYSVLARQTDLAGNQSVNSGLITVVIDKTAPAAPTVSGIASGSYKTNQSFTVTGEPGTTLEYSVNNGSTWTVYSTQVTLSAEGTYEVITRQTDAAGNHSASSSLITVVIDKTAPAAPIVSGISTGSFNTNQSFTVTGEVGATLEYSLDNGATWSAYSAQVTLSAEGTYSVLARQTDLAGNQSVNSNLTTVVMDKTAPAAPTVSGIASGSYKTNQTFTVTGEPGTTLEYSVNNGSTWTVYSTQVTLSAEGTYEVIARQTDAAGNHSASSSLITVVIDKTVPAAPTVSGISTGSFNTNQSFTVTGEVGATLEYSLDNGTTWNVYSAQVTLSAEGTYSVLARQTDLAGNQSVNSGLITVVIDKTAPTAPTVNGISTGSYNTNQSFTVTGEAGATLEYSLNNGSTWSVYATPVTLSAEGTYEVIAKQTDVAGNQSATSNIITVTIDKTRPAIATIVPVDGATQVELEATITISFTESLSTNTKGTVSFGNPAVTFTDGINCTMNFSTTVKPNDTVTIDPNNSFNAETIYSNITINGFKDTVENEMTNYSDSNYDFTTKSVASVPEDYVARWKFDQNLSDETGTYNLTVLTGSATFTSSSYMEGIGSVEVNGADLSPNSKSPTFTNDSISITACFYANIGATGFPTVVEQDGIMAIYYDVANAKIIGELLYSQTKVEITNVNKGTWYHVVATYDGSELKLYLNGGSQMASTMIIDDISLEGQTYIYIGGSNGNYFWQGYLDDVMVYDRALTSSEISNIFNSY